MTYRIKQHHTFRRTVSTLLPDPDKLDRDIDVKWVAEFRVLNKSEAKSLHKEQSRLMRRLLEARKEQWDDDRLEALEEEVERANVTTLDRILVGIDNSGAHKLEVEKCDENGEVITDADGQAVLLEGDELIDWVKNQPAFANSAAQKYNEATEGVDGKNSKASAGK